MIKLFIYIFTSLIMVAGMVCIHYLRYSDDSEKNLQKITALTGITSPVLSVAYYEPRVLLYDETINPAYPQMQPINRMDFVYAK